MKRNRQKLIGVFLALAMLVTMIPATAFAGNENAGSDDSITVNVTMSLAGEIATATSDDYDGTPMVQIPVSVTDRNESGGYDIDDVLTCVHEIYHEDGAEAYQKSTSGWITELWGESGAFGYYLNDAMCMGITDAVADGDYVTAFTYDDSDYYTDLYGFFVDSSDSDTSRPVITAKAGEPVAIALYGYSMWTMKSDPVGGADIYINGEYDEGYITEDEEGRIIDTETGESYLTFDEAGTYEIMAAGEPMGTLVPAICKVTVLSESDYVLGKAIEQITWDSFASEAQDKVTTSIYGLPAEVKVDNETVSVKWSSDDTTGVAAVYDDYYSQGAQYVYVDRPAANDCSFKLTATFKYGEDTKTKDFAVTVKCEGVNENKTSAVDFGTLMKTIAGTEPFTSNTDAWTVMDRAAYDGEDISGEDYGYSSAVASKLADAATDNDLTQGALSRVDVSGYYAIYTIPYLELAYLATGEERTANGHDVDTQLSAMVSYLNNLDTNYADTDDFTPVMAALAPYYTGQESIPNDCTVTLNDVKDSVNSAVTVLSSKQNDDGTFSYYGASNSNSTALAVVALSALGIDAHKDSRFIKQNKSAVEGLLSFALEDNSGFGYKGNVTLNTLSTEQGFRALVSYARFKETGKAYNIYIQAADSEEAAADPRIKATGTGSSGSSSNKDQDKTLTVTVSIKSDSDYWLKNAKVELSEKDCTVSAAVVSACKDNSITQVGADKGYLRSMTYNGKTLAEFTMGQNSGWLYKVNGKLPDVGMLDYTLESGDTVLVYYTEDYTKDPDAGDQPGDEPGTDPGKDPSASKFKDMDNHWAKEDVDYLAGKGYINGLTEDTFGPSVTMSRAMLVTILYRIDGAKADGSANAFTDVEKGSWYEDAVVWAQKNGIVNGISDSKFGPNDPVTREQTAAIIERYAKFKKIETGSKVQETGFADEASISDYAIDSVKWACAAGLIVGEDKDGKTVFRPKDSLNRAEAATILARYIRTLA